MKDQLTYTSPSGNRYEVAPSTLTRMAGGLTEGCELHSVEYTQWDIFHNGAWVQYCFDENAIGETVGRYETLGVDLGSAYD